MSWNCDIMFDFILLWYGDTVFVQYNQFCISTEISNFSTSDIFCYPNLLLHLPGLIFVWSILNHQLLYRFKLVLLLWCLSSTLFESMKPSRLSRWIKRFNICNILTFSLRLSICLRSCWITISSSHASSSPNLSTRNTDITILLYFTLVKFSFLCLRLISWI